MTSVDRPVVDFDHHSSEYAESSEKINADLLARCPVAWSPNHDGFWVVSGHEDVVLISRDDATFSSDHDTTGDGNGTGGVTIPASPFRSVPIEMDPPEFNAYRKLLNPYFAPSAAKRWEPFIDGLCHQALDAIADKGEGDLVLDLANPVPAMFTLALIGVPLKDWKAYADPAHRMVSTPQDADDFPDAVEGCVGMISLLWEAVEQAQANPGDNFLSYLATVQVDGGPLSELRIIEILFLLIFGGVDTTTGLTANALVWLADHPTERKLLAARPELMPKAIEEFLRYFTPVQTMGRTAMSHTTLSGCSISPAERVMMNFAAANRDAALFEDPDELRLDRSPNRHVSFGLGIHRCLGSNFARTLTTAMINAVLTRMPDYVVDLCAAERYRTIGTVNGWSQVPVSFHPTLSRDTKLPEAPTFRMRQID